MDSRIEKAIVEQLQQELQQSNIEHFYIYSMVSELLIM